MNIIDETKYNEEEGDELFDFIPLPEQKEVHDYENLTEFELLEFQKRNLTVYYEEDDTHNIQINEEEFNVIRKYYEVPIIQKGWPRVGFQKIKVNNRLYFIVDYDMENYLPLETMEELFSYIEYKKSEDWFKYKTRQIKKKPKL